MALVQEMFGKLAIRHCRRNVPHLQVSLVVYRYICRRLTTASSSSGHSYSRIGRKKPPISNRTRWPASLRDFISGTPIMTPKLPLFGRCQLDFGTCMLNLGAITSLSGFLMTDVLLLRTLSVVGSFCGMTYNLTRKPKQMNAVAWGVVFASVNLVQIYRLLQERREVKFSVEEGRLFYRQFAPFGCEPVLFQKLLKLAEWKSYKQGEVIVRDNKPLDCIYILFRGTAAAVDPKQEEGTNELYTYSGGENGSIIGATALVDQTVTKHNYPNRVVAKEPVRLVGFKTEKLRAFLQTEPSAEAALLHLAYVDLIGGLRRARLHTKKQELGQALHELKIMLVQSCADGIIQPQERKLIREHMETHNITHSQLVALLQSETIGWTEAEWSDGAKHSKIISSLTNGSAPLWLLFRQRRQGTTSV